MKYQVVSLAAVFLALVGVALVTADTEAGHKRKGGDCCCAPQETHGCSGPVYGSCHGGQEWYGNGCHGAAGCHGGMPMQGEMHHQNGVDQEGSGQDYAPPAAPTGPPSASLEDGSVNTVSTRSQFGFRTAQFVR